MGREVPSHQRAPRPSLTSPSQHSPTTNHISPPAPSSYYSTKHARPQKPGAAPALLVSVRRWGLRFAVAVEFGSGRYVDVEHVLVEEVEGRLVVGGRAA
ncbi:hypothetical protein PENSPDRAFT_80395 [Peniophora sp. CONT]|nr:hypothetical protein PENSPDRAFT_80395 [Peniophora sp. CONT]